jgi:undecaprenyl-diphosphatase
MEYLQALILGIVQGVTEFLPISSTAHLIIFRDVFQWGAVTCTVAEKAAGCADRVGWSKAAIDGIQFGSVIAVVMYFWNDIVKLLEQRLAAGRVEDFCGYCARFDSGPSNGLFVKESL